VLRSFYVRCATLLRARRGVDELAATGERHTRRRGLKLSGSVRLVRKNRDQQRSR
jgi:hypothetical protein